MEYAIGAISGIVGLAIGFFVDRMIKGTAHKTRAELLADAERDVDAFRKDQELSVKEELLRNCAALTAVPGHY